MEEVRGKMREELDRIISVLLVRYPFFGLLLKNAKIYVSEKVPYSFNVDERGWIYIKYSEYEKMKIKEKAFALMHEALHSALMQPARGKNKAHVLWNIICDAVVNEMLRKSGISFTDDDISFQHLRGLFGELPENVETWSDEEIYLWVLRRGGRGESGVEELEKKTEEMKRDFIQGKPEDAEEIQEGAEFQKSEDIEDIKKGWKNAIIDAYVTTKMAGKIPAGLEIVLNGLLKPKQDLRTKIRNYIRFTLFRYGTDWRRPSRKHKDLLGFKEWKRIPKIWVLIDTSGSMGKRELELALGVVVQFAEMTEVTVIPWDADHYGEMKVKRVGDVLSKVKLRGGGGTVIRPVLEYVNQKIRNDVVVVITDGHIYDYTGAENEMKKLLGRASLVLWLYTEKEPTFKFSATNFVAEKLLARE